MARKEPVIVERRPPASADEGEALTLWAEVRAILFFTAATLATLALLSYHPNDPGPFLLGEGYLVDRIHNWAGYAGAYFADAVIYIFGLVGVWIPLLLARLGLVTLLGRPVFSISRCLVWLSLFLSQTAFFQWILGNQTITLHGCKTPAPVPMGGALGIIIGDLLERVFNYVGTSFILPVWVLLTLMFLWQLSLRTVGETALKPLRSLADRLRLRRDRKRIAEERQEARTQVRQKQAERQQMVESRKAVTPVKVSQRIAPPNLPLDPAPSVEGYIVPPTNLLDPPRTQPPVNKGLLQETARQIEKRLLEFGVEGQVAEIHPGPIVTIFEFHPAPGIKYNRVVSFADDLALTLKADHVRMDRVGGKASIGIEVPNLQREIISFREIVESQDYRNLPGKLPLALGKGVQGQPFVTTLDAMPHLLVAGTTGSGKSVGINVLIHSILFRSGPDEVKFILIDPKQVELKIYEGLPHLLVPVVTDVKKAVFALHWAVKEMGERYKMLAACKVRTIDQFNQYLQQAQAHTPVPQDAEMAGVTLKPLPHIVIVIDELYDLMAAAAKDVETFIARLSAMARAVGIHLILATQRPSRDVLTGVIKSNMPARLAFQVREKLESRLILDQNGAEALTGKGDLLFLPPGTGRLTRVHGAFLSTIETKRVLEYLCRAAKPVFDPEILKDQGPSGEGGSGGDGEEPQDDSDPLYADAVKLVARTGVASASNLQRRMRIGYARAARLLDVMEKNGIVGPTDGAKPREILIEPEEAGE